MAVERYGRYWRELRPETVEQLTELAAPGMRFRDPFNDLTGAHRIVGLLQRAFQRSRDLRFVLTDVAASERAAYYRWRCTFSHPALTRGRTWTLEGMSEVTFDADGRVLAHVDHWDAGGQLLARLPFAGWIVRRLLGSFRE